MEKDAITKINFISGPIDLSLEYQWSPLLLTEERFKELKKEKMPFFKEVINDGIVI